MKWPTGYTTHEHRHLHAEYSIWNQSIGIVIQEFVESFFLSWFSFVIFKFTRMNFTVLFQLTLHSVELLFLLLHMIYLHHVHRSCSFSVFSFIVAVDNDGDDDDDSGGGNLVSNTFCLHKVLFTICAIWWCCVFSSQSTILCFEYGKLRCAISSFFLFFSILLAAFAWFFCDRVRFYEKKRN